MNPTETLPLVNPDFVSALATACGQVRTRASDRLAKAHDASHYLLTPQAVAIAATPAEVAAILAVSRSHRVPATFRSGGTSLSGQAGTDGILVDTRQNFRRIDVLDDGDRVRAEPGATVRAVNGRLARHGRRLGPDPASEIACTIGGVVANNSSGMSCGIHSNAYQTLESAVLVLPSGTIIDTGAPDADRQLQEHEPALHAGLALLRERVRSNPESVKTLQRLHAIKNTMGYGLNTFLDHTSPVDILTHLVVGSEGTLAFVAEATFRTLPVMPHVATGLLLFKGLAEATASLPALVDAGFATLELLDAASLRVAQQSPEATADLTGLKVENHAAILVELQELTIDSLEIQIAKAHALFPSLPLVTACILSTDAEVRSQLWHIRKGLFTSVAGARPPGTTALLEDIAVPVECLNETCTRLLDLFDQYDYEGSVIFGHAKDGNIHFLINEQFDDPAKIARYEAFTDAMVDLVLSQGGTLKAEHGTGRIMAPYVQRQYGGELYDVMWEVKRLLDPDLLLNPGVLICGDPKAHTTNLKTVPPVETEVDRCVECGYCEPACPSRDLTLTPRERIVLRRELQRARDRGDYKLARALHEEYQYDGLETCAVDGMCQTACPVLINTGDLVRRLRADNQNPLTQKAWKAAATQWGTVTTVGGAALSIADKFPAVLPQLATRIGRRVFGAEAVPLYTADLPAGGSRRNVIDQPEPAAVYFSSCTTTMFGGDGKKNVADAFVELCERVDVRLRTPDDLPSLCCGTPWKSKGLTEGFEVMKRTVTSSLLRATDNGRLPVVCDASSCTEGLQILLNAAAEHRIRVLDAVEFVDERVLALLPAGEKIPVLTLHPTCSSTHLGINPALTRVAATVADKVVIPENWGCCGFAGDRGMLHPELTASATVAEAVSVANTNSDAHASVNRTCELGMSRATGYEYRHILEVLDDIMAPAQQGNGDGSNPGTAGARERL